LKQKALIEIKTAQVIFRLLSRAARAHGAASATMADHPEL
jgi:hypothetical protein